MLIKRWLCDDCDAIERNWDYISFLQIFLNILEYIWWPLHTSFVFMGMELIYLKLVVSIIFYHFLFFHQLIAL